MFSKTTNNNDVDDDKDDQRKSPTKKIPQTENRKRRNHLFVSVFLSVPLSFRQLSEFCLVLEKKHRQDPFICSKFFSSAPGKTCVTPSEGGKKLLRLGEALGSHRVNQSSVEGGGLSFPH